MNEQLLLRLRRERPGVASFAWRKSACEVLYPDNKDRLSSGVARLKP